MTEIIEIYTDHDCKTHFVGRCYYGLTRGHQSSMFTYANKWLDNASAFALDPANLPLKAEPFYVSSERSALPGALRDSAPDRWGRLLVKRAFRKTEQNRTLSEIDYLLAITDQARIGALRFKREGEQTFDRNLGRYRIPSLIRLPDLLNAVDAIQSNTETAEDLKLLLNEGSPLGGARPKSVVVTDDGMLAIAKFPKLDDDRSIPHGEILALNLAARAGVTAARGRILNVAGRAVALITRFDRQVNRRTPFLSAMSILGLNDGDVATYTDIAEIIRMYSSSPIEDLHELWRRVVLNVLISNLDDHLRNHAFLYDQNNMWRLSPAYDLNPVPLVEKVRELVTWISEEGPEASLDLARQAAHFFALSRDQAENIIDEVKTAVKNWRATARSIGMSAADIEYYATAIDIRG